MKNESFEKAKRGRKLTSGQKKAVKGLSKNAKQIPLSLIDKRWAKVPEHLDTAKMLMNMLAPDKDEIHSYQEAVKLFNEEHGRFFFLTYTPKKGSHHIMVHYQGKYTPTDYRFGEMEGELKGMVKMIKIRKRQEFLDEAGIIMI